MKIFAAGVATETNTFSPIPTSLDDYTVQRGSQRGRDAASTFDLEEIWGKRARERGDDFVFSLMAFAQPAGLTTRAAYHALRDEMLQDLQAAMPIDVALLMLHGAMVAQGYDDCEEDLIRRVREIVGANAVIAVELDLHCHLSASKIAAADLIVTYEEYPHIDINERGRELFDLAIRTKLGEIRPTMAIFDCRMMGLYPTTRQPLRGFVDAMKEAGRREGVLSVSFGHGFQFADLPHGGAKMLCVTDGNPGLAREVAREFGVRVHAMRRQIGFDSISLPLEEALTHAMGSEKLPVVVADQSDNVGGGAGGDATFVLRWLLDRKARDVAIAILYDPEAVRIARRAGVGADLPMRLGGKLGPLSGDPLDVDVQVLALRDNWQHRLPQRSGEPVLFPLGDVAALRCGGIDVVVSSVRCQCYCPSIFTDLGIDPTRKRLLVVKSAQHFYSTFSPIADEVIYMAAPGAVPPDPRLNRYLRLDTRNLYPWVDEPALSAL